jgi:hypothetical protein
VLFFGFTWLADRWWPWGAATTALGVGVIWLVLTVAFEFFMVVVLAGKPVEVARAQYDARSGNLWPFLLVAILLIPLAVWALHEGRGPG